MNRKKVTHSSKKVLAVVLCLVAMTGAGCIANERSAPFVEDFTLNTIDDTGGDGCFEFLNDSFTECVAECGSNERLATEEEITALIDDIDSLEGLSDEEEEDLVNLVAQSKGVCVDQIERPNETIQVTSGTCACRDTTPIALNNCASFCSGRNTEGQDILFGSVILGPEVELNETLGSLANWCGVEIGDGLVNPSCVVEFDDGSSVRSFELTNFTSPTSFEVDIKNLPEDVTFIGRVKEVTSGATTTSFQLRKFTPDSDDPPDGPLKIMATSMYSCFSRAGNVTPDGFDFTLALGLHFFFAANKTPPSLPPLGTGQVFCHDINTYGLADSPLFPRLELIPQHFAIWDESDQRFVDTDQNGKSDVNDIIQQRLLDEYSVSREINIFASLPWPNTIPTQDRPDTTSTVGFFMQPWIDGNTGLGFCPDQDRYNGTDPTFRVMKEVIGVDTEGLFVAEREPLVIPGGNGGFTTAPPDIMLIREGLLEKIWFYYEDGKHFIPDEISAGQKTIMYYWPPDVDNPTIRKSTQYIYIVRAPSDIGGAASTAGSGVPTSISPPDKRFGCVPALD